MSLSGLVVAVVLGKDVSASLGCLKRLGDCGCFRLVVSRRCGLALARNECFGFAGPDDLVVMVDDDLVFMGELLDWCCCNVRRGSFAMAVVGEHVSSRVLVVSKSDFVLVGGFNPRFKLIFEDGDFYRRALGKGLKFHAVPSGLFSHVAHKPREHESLGGLIKFNLEYCRVFVSFPSWVIRNPLRFFAFPFRSKVNVGIGVFISFVRVWFTSIYLIGKLFGVVYYES